MGVVVSLYSTKNNEIKRFLNSYYAKPVYLDNDLKWEYYFENPLQSAEIIGTFIDNNENYKIINNIYFEYICNIISRASPNLP